MADINERKELERQISASKRELRELECCEEALLQHIPRAGFSVAVERTTMREKIAVLCDSIRKLEQCLRGA